MLIQLVLQKIISKKKNKSEAAIASSLSAKIYKLKILAPNIENEKGNATRFLIMGKEVSQPDFGEKKYIGFDNFKVLWNDPIFWITGRFCYQWC